jgi:hypothetical protein
MGGVIALLIVVAFLYVTLARLTSPVPARVVKTPQTRTLGRQLIVGRKLTGMGVRDG